MDVLHLNLCDYPISPSETYYALHSITDSILQLHDHDFYEILFVLSGSMDFSLCGHRLSLQAGDLLLVRPGDVHCKISTGGPCQHINLAFPCSAVDALFSFIYDDEVRERMDQMAFIPVIHLSKNDKSILQHDLDRLNLLPVHRYKLIRMHLRLLLLNIVNNHLSDLLLKEYSLTNRASFPSWLPDILRQMENPAFFSYNLDDWAAASGKSKEYFCRSFQKHMNTTPGRYLNSLHLNYAANLLAHTDYEIIDIAYDAGFESLSYFYHLFKREFGVSPLKYRQKHTLQQR